MLSRVRDELNRLEREKLRVTFSADPQMSGGAGVVT